VRVLVHAQPSGTRPGAGSDSHRIGRREALYAQLKKDFADPVSVTQITWEQEDSIWILFERRPMSSYARFLSDWVPGNPAFLVRQYNEAAELRRGKLEKALSAEHDTMKSSVGRWLETSRRPNHRRTSLPPAPATAPSPPCRRPWPRPTASSPCASRSRTSAIRSAGAAPSGGVPGPDRGLAKQVDAALAGAIGGKPDALAAVVAVRAEADKASSEILLANPLLQGMDKLLLARGGPGFNSNWGGPNSLGSELVVLSPVRPDGEVKVLHTVQGSMSNFDLSFDAKKILYSNGRHIFEVNADGTGLRQITQQTDPTCFTTTPATCPTATSYSFPPPASRPCLAPASGTSAIST